MKTLRRGFFVCTAGAVLCATTALTAASPALAAAVPGPGPGGGGGGGTDIRLTTTGNCGDQLRLRVRNTGDTIELNITIPAADPAEVGTSPPRCRTTVH